MILNQIPPVMWRPIAVAALTLLSGCGPRPDAAASSAEVATKAAPTDSTRPTAVTVDSGDVAAQRPVRTDSTSRIVAKLAEGRTKKDSVSLVSAIRTGRRVLETWPKGPTPAGPTILPAKRIVAYYGNPLSKKMGALGEYPVDEMLSRLDREVAAWNAADPSTPVQPALHLVAVVAQGSAGRDGKWRSRMDSALINRVHGWAQSRKAILFLDIQVAKSTLQEELPKLLPYLTRPDVHLGIDPEFSMHYSREGLAPGAKIGIMDAADVNYVIRTLSKLVADHNLPPKVLVVHRFTQGMVTNAMQITPDPRVQVVMHMDGWGPPWLKFDSYRAYSVLEPVQYTGFKLFYHNDTKKGDRLLTPEELLQLVPRPLYIQYQ
jgi:hypothetical protein